jgi:hypothetical protein
LLLLECTAHEQDQERQIQTMPVEDLVLRFVKHLVELSLGLRSWHLNVAISRLLHGFPIKTAWKIQKLLEQEDWSDRLKEYPSDTLRRSMIDSKAKLEASLVERFGRHLDGSSGPRAPAWRVLTPTERESWYSLIEATRRQLDLWDGPECDRLLPTGNQDPANLPSFRQADPSAEEVTRVEIARKSALICPRCYSQLATFFELPEPSSNLQMPHFAATGPSDPTNAVRASPLGGQLPTSGLSSERFQGLLARLALDSRSRSQLPSVLTVRVDGQAVARWPVGEASAAEISLGSRAQRIEIAADQAQGSVPVAAFLVASLTAGRHYSVYRDRQRELTLELVTDAIGGSEAWAVQLRVEMASVTRWWGRLSRAVASPAERLRLRASPLLGRWVAAAAVVVVAVGLLLFYPPAGTELTPKAEVAFRHLFPPDTAERVAAEVQVLDIPRHAGSLVVVIPLESTAPGSVYRLELQAPSGTLWRFDSVDPIDAELSIALPAALLSEGIYRLQITGGDAQSADDTTDIFFQVGFDG